MRPKAIKRSADEVRKRMDDCEASVNASSQAWAKRAEEEASARNVQLSKLSRMLSEETDARKEGDRQASRNLSGLKDAIAADESKYTREQRESSSRIDSCLSGLRVEQKERAALAEELASTVKQHRRQLEEEWKRHCAGIASETSTTLEELRSALERDLAVDRRERSEQAAAIPSMATAIKELEAGRQRLVDRLEEVRAKIEGEQRAREEGQHGLSDTIAAVRTLVSDRLGDGRIEAAQEGVRHVQSEVETVRDSLTKVVEAVQQERHSRQEGDAKLREDCREAIQQEINARLRLDSKMRDQVEQEARSRQDAVKLIHEAIDEVRQGLETHTHEMAFDEQFHEDDARGGSSPPMSLRGESRLLAAGS